ncbi:hypothetical protein AAF712_004828 [Marasmius tenuissimus]|uniref:Uncharacterized protein n=1 Tax=Marasmius tenuissimus TaxID=585030 RepID=A0ABR3A3J8_9AGAR
MSFCVLCGIDSNLVASSFVKDTFQGFQTSEIVKVAAATPFAVSAVLSDVFIAGSLCFVLQEGRSGMHK